MVIPEGHDENPLPAEGRVELGEASDLREAVAVTKGLELGGAELGSDGVTGHAADGRVGHVNLGAILDEVLRDLVVGELGDDAGCSWSAIGPLCRLLKARGRARL